MMRLSSIVAAKAVAFHEASRPEFREYAAQIVRNARALSDALAAAGFRIVSGGTDNHLVLVDLRPFGVNGKVGQESLDLAGITCNKNAIPNDPEKPFVTSGIRLGTASVTTTGMAEPEMAEIAELIGTVLRARPIEEKISLTQRFIREMLPLFDTGVLKPVIDSRYPMERVADAQAYAELTARVLGEAALVPARLRFGASGLLTDIEAVLAGAAGSSGDSSGY